ncbi:Gti1/Pac2 family-domain-containing protein [Syncephalis fuscata]|nr:Gti1/Pac2 family-domain-containing protein [Syncephalis fuscata]
MFKSSTAHFLETCFALVTTTEDALLIFEACHQGILSFAARRLLECEKSTIRPGSVYTFDEETSGVRRWTDGRLWSPSRINGNFLVYREAKLKIPWRPNRSRKLFSRLWNIIAPSNDDDEDEDNSDDEEKMTADNGEVFSIGRLLEKTTTATANGQNQCSYSSLKSTKDVKAALHRLYKIYPEISEFHTSQILNSNKGLYVLKINGMIKRTISVKINGHPCHLVAYQHSDRAQSPLNLKHPDQMPLLAGLTVSPQLIEQQNFRRPLRPFNNIARLATLQKDKLLLDPSLVGRRQSLSASPIVKTEDEDPNLSFPSSRAISTDRFNNANIQQHKPYQLEPPPPPPSSPLYTLPYTTSSTTNSLASCPLYHSSIPPPASSRIVSCGPPPFPSQYSLLPTSTAALTTLSSIHSQEMNMAIIIGAPSNETRHTSLSMSDDTVFKEELFCNYMSNAFPHQ